MSLQIWLPLNGNLQQQGLSNANATIMGTGITYSAGKIGQAATFPNNCNSCIYLPRLRLQTGTYAAWIKVIGSGATARQCIISEGRDSYNDGVEIYTNQAGTSLSFKAHEKTITTTIVLNQWYHIAGTFGNGQVKLYVDGVLKGSNTYTADMTYQYALDLVLGKMSYSYTNTSNYFSFNGQLNDVRIYDHCLSAKEVEEISKGLILHYKLDGPKESIPHPAGPENLFIGSAFSTTDVNNMVANSSTDWTKYFRWYNGSKSIHTFSDGIDTIKLNATGNLGIAFTRKATDINLDSNSYYTISCEAKCTKSGAQLSIGRSYYTTGNSWTWRGGENKTTFNAVDTWQTFTLTFKPDANTQYICYCFTCANGTSGGTDTFSIRHCKLEKGSTATTWTLNQLDDTYNQSLITDNTWTIEPDCSGYGHNGTIIGTISTDTVTPRYNQAAHISATNQKIKISGLTTSGFGNSYSFAWWEKISSVTPMHWGFSDGIRLNGLYTGRLWNTGDSSDNPLYKPGTTTQVTAPTVNTWHHWVMTGDGTTCKVYQDGIFWAQAKTYKSISGTTIYINGWNSNTDYSSNNASISDFRIYATALTETQVKELYNTSATIDNLGNGYAREEIEDSSLNMTKTGQFHNNELLDDNNYTTASITKVDKQLKVNSFYEY